jgi:hypothetical protein
MSYYHGHPRHDNLDMTKLALYVPQIFEKISGNLECYLEQLEQDETIDGDE